MMKTTLFSREAGFGKEDAKELEKASLQVRHICDKVLQMLYTHLPTGLWEAWFGLPHDAGAWQTPGRNSGGVMLQEWFSGPGGWKCTLSAQLSAKREGEAEACESAAAVLAAADAADGDKPSLTLQAILWSMYEKTMLLHPFLGTEPFLDAEELMVVGTYLLPTYVSEIRFRELGKAYREYRAGSMCFYQEQLDGSSHPVHAYVQ